MSQHAQGLPQDPTLRPHQYREQVGIEQDQLFKKSGHGKIKYELRKEFTELIAGRPIHAEVTDEVVKDFRDYKLVLSDNIITNFDYFHLHPEYWGSYSYNSTYINRTPKWLYTCFLARTCPFRQSWFYQLVRRQLLDLGAVSFLLDMRERHAPPGVDVKNKAQVYEWVFSQNLEIFRDEHEAMRDQVPFRNFDDDLDQVMTDSKVNIIVETYFDEPGVVALSEKTFRALQLPRPFLLFSNVGAIATLREHGFDLYDDIVSHDYDNLEHPVSRQVMIFEQVEKLKNLNFDQSMLDKFELRAEHNRQLLKNYRQDWPKKHAQARELINGFV